MSIGQNTLGWLLIELFQIDKESHRPSLQQRGVLANILPEYRVIKQPLEIHFRLPDHRPTFTPSSTGSEIYREFVEGMPLQKWHSIIELGKSCVRAK